MTGAEGIRVRISPSQRRRHRRARQRQRVPLSMAPATLALPPGLCVQRQCEPPSAPALIAHSLQSPGAHALPRLPGLTQHQRPLLPAHEMPIYAIPRTMNAVIFQKNFVIKKFQEPLSYSADAFDYRPADVQIRLPFAQYQQIGRKVMSVLVSLESIFGNVSEEQLVAHCVTLGIAAVLDSGEHGLPLTESRQLLHRIVKRMIEKDRVILIYREADNPVRPRKRLLTLHPNVAAADSPIDSG